MHRTGFRVITVATVLLAAGCGGAPALPPAPPASSLPSAEYRIGPGDSLNIFVWRNPELTVTVPVRPDGRLSIPLVEDVVAIGKTPSCPRTRIRATTWQSISKSRWLRSSWKALSDRSPIKSALSAKPRNREHSPIART